jgi:hypothetical protein
MTTQVVNLKHEAYDVYIGRSSVWGNPFRIGKAGDRATVIRKYAQWIPTQPQLLARLGELRGKRLGCFCMPRSGCPDDPICHGQILARLADALVDETIHPTITEEGGVTMQTMRSLTVADREHVQREVDRAQQASARYNELHTAYWHAVERAQRAGGDPRQDAAVQAAHEKLDQARPLLAQIRAGAQATAQLAGWDWPIQQTAPWATATSVPDLEPTLLPPRPADSVPVEAPTRAKARRRKPVPAPVMIERSDPPAVQQAKARLNAQLAEAEKLGKSGAWAPLKNAVSALQQLVTPAPILPH